jgi:hypothetical protein
MSDGGKGSKPRPLSVSQEEYDQRFDAIFGKKKQTDSEKVDELEEYKRQAQEIWNDSCTSPRKK